MEYEKQGCLHEMFMRQAKMSPNAVAIVTDDGKTLTYKELDRVTDILATHLHGNGVVADSVVGIYLERCMEYPIAYIAILKAGGAYLHLDVVDAQSFRDDILQDAKPVSVITSKNLVPRIKGVPNVTTLDENWPEKMNEENTHRGLDISMCPQVTLDNLAFVAYSSGSTGKPKGIMVPHRSPVFSYNWHYIHYPYEEEEHMACNLFFPWEMLRPLLKGFPLYIVPDDVIYNPALFLTYLERHSITRMLFTSSLMETILDADNLDFASALSRFRLIVLSGEVVTVSLMERLTKMVPEVTVMNLYSMSEAHDVAANNLTQDIKHIMESSTIGKTRTYCPVGKPLPGVHVVIMNNEMELQPIGSPGEIYVASPALARAYLNLPEVNAHKFISRPENVPEYVGDRLFKTGDWGYLLSDGNLEICGRCDTLLKIRGYSVEIQAVEAALLNLPMVNACTVLTKGDEGEDKYMVAYIVPAGQTSKKEIRSALKTKMIGYKIPSYFVFLKSLPLGANGKQDKKALPDFNPETAISPINGEQGYPSTETERKVAAMWSDLLKIKNVDCQESFFDLGGHSLLASRLMNQIKDTFGVEVTFQQMFVTHSTVTHMSSLIDSLEAKCDNMSAP